MIELPHLNNQLLNLIKILIIVYSHTTRIIDCIEPCIICIYFIFYLPVGKLEDMANVYVIQYVVIVSTL